MFTEIIKILCLPITFVNLQLKTKHVQEIMIRFTI